MLGGSQKKVPSKSPALLGLNHPNQKKKKKNAIAANIIETGINDQNEHNLKGPNNNLTVTFFS